MAESIIQMIPQQSSIAPRTAPPKLEGCFTPLIPSIVRRPNESTVALSLADRLRFYPAENGLPTQGLSAAFAYRTLETNFGLVIAQFPNAHLDGFACNLRKLECVADALTKILTSGKPLAQTYVFDESRLRELRC
jgi:hypothetical protein